MLVVEICRKKGWRINPDDALVNNIFRALGKTDGHCPTKVENRKGHDQCPCSSYLQDGVCYCGLYVKENTNVTAKTKQDNQLLITGVLD